MEPTQALVYINLNPPTATILGAVLLDEPLLASSVVGILVVLTGVLLVNRSGHVHSVATDPAEIAIPS